MQHEPVEELPKPTPLSGMEDSIGDLGAQWARESSRPRVTRQTLEGWHALLHDWIADESIPLLIRKASTVRGSEVIHSSGRIIVPTDNSPAQWACYLAVTGVFPSIDEIKHRFDSSTIPVSFAHKPSERDQRRHHGTLGKFSVNKQGWKLCHIEEVGLKSRDRLEDIDMTKLEMAFCRLLDPSNYFLMPLKWGGLGEVNAFIDGFKSNLPDQERGPGLCELQTLVKGPGS